MNHSLAERLFEADISIDGIWPFPFGVASEGLIAAIEYRDDLPGPLQPLVNKMTDDDRATMFGGDDDWRTKEILAEFDSYGFRDGVYGYLIKAWRPVYEKANGGGVNYSWGYTTSDMFFAPTADEAVALACEWGENAMNEAFNVEAAE